MQAAARKLQASQRSFLGRRGTAPEYCPLELQTKPFQSFLEHSLQVFLPASALTMQPLFFCRPIILTLMLKMLKPFQSAILHAICHASPHQPHYQIPRRLYKSSQSFLSIQHSTHSSYALPNVHEPLFLILLLLFILTTYVLTFLPAIIQEISDIATFARFAERLRLVKIPTRTLDYTLAHV